MKIRGMEDLLLDPPRFCSEKFQQGEIIYNQTRSSGDDWRQPNPIVSLFQDIPTVLSGLNQYLLNALQLQISCLSCKDLVFFCFSDVVPMHPLGLQFLCLLFFEIRNRPNFGSEYCGFKRKATGLKAILSWLNTLSVYWKDRYMPCQNCKSGLDSIQHSPCLAAAFSAKLPSASFGVLISLKL